MRRHAAFALALLLRASAVVGQEAAPPYPLDPLNAGELRAATAILRADGKFAAERSLVTLELREPSKQALAAPGAPPPREARAVVYDRATRSTYEAVVDLDAKRVTGWRAVPGVQPPFLASDYILLRQVLWADSAWRRAMRARGITDLSAVSAYPWMGGDYDDVPRGARVIRSTFYYRGGARNEYARPIEGVAAFVDLDARRVTRLVDTGVVPMAEPRDFRGGEDDAEPAPAAAAPSTPGVAVAGHEVRWDRWRFRYAVGPREGLVLYRVRWIDGARERSVLYRASVSEMVVPYGDPDATWFFRGAFDLGEYGLGGWFTSRLDANLDAPSGAVFLPAQFADETGEVVTVPRAAVLYERDGGLLWKHADVLAGRNQARRGRELVVAYTVTVGNYDYVFRWIFRQDGTIQSEAQLTGIMAVKGVPVDAGAGHGDGFGHTVQRGLVAVHHQHFFNYRLDFDIDGPNNRVVQIDTRPLPPGRENPYGNAFRSEETVLRRELEARRQLSLETSRSWRVENPEVRTTLGNHPGYALVPGANTVPYAAPGSSVRRRAGFVDAHVWVTAFDPGEMNAAGAFVNQSRGGDGLPAWTRANRPLEDRDVVVWYTMGTTHLPRPEDWPVMEATTLGFQIVPFGFFDHNPALDPPAAQPGG